MKTVAVVDLNGEMKEKEKLLIFLLPADVVVRGQGGNNADIH